MKKIILASNNANKIREARHILKGTDIEICSLKEAGIVSEPIEDGKTFEENAIIKARATHEKSGMPVIADDSGLTIDVLDGKPGILSSRFSGPTGNDDDNNGKAVEMIRATGNNSSAASFVCSIAYIDEKGNIATFSGECMGKFILEPRGNRGFGYDPYFLVMEYGRTMAELSDEEKNLISHRGKALSKLAEYIMEVQK